MRYWDSRVSPIAVQTPVGPALTVGTAERVEVRKPSEAEVALKAALKKAVSLGNHTYSIAQLVGVYPA